MKPDFLQYLRERVLLADGAIGTYLYGKGIEPDKNNERLNLDDPDLVYSMHEEYIRAGRARWRIESETFNTLKNQGYNLGYNFGLGKKHLSSVFVHLMMLAFLVDQVQQLCCPLFKEAWAVLQDKRRLWEGIRSRFDLLDCPSMEAILLHVVHRLALQPQQLE